MALRPELEAARAKLFKQLSTTVERPGANTSYLIIGARDTGKSLVSRCGLREMDSHSTNNILPRRLCMESGVTHSHGA